MVRRLLEIETYRMMASLSLEDARELASDLDAYDQALLTLSNRNAGSGVDARALLDDIALLSKQVVAAAVRHRHRFSATQAYSKLVFERLQELRETHAPGYQRLGIFIERRFNPTIRFCAATEQRLDQLAMSVANFGDLLQARVQVDMEDQNALILKSLNARADAQVKIQRAVEGLSVIAISYYLFSLCKLFYSAVVTLGAPISAREAMAYMGPLLFGILAIILVRIKKAKEH